MFASSSAAIVVFHIFTKLVADEVSRGFVLGPKILTGFGFGLP
jgi:hypothetical protein